MKILIADDDADLRGLIGFTLTRAGFDICVASDGRSALQVFSREAPDFALLDINMPGLNGLEVCRHIRRDSPIPIMMLTVRDHEDDLVAAIDAGADDYVAKPFSPRALLARVRALARRAEQHDEAVVLAGKVRLHLEQHVIDTGGEPVHLTPLEVKALQLLMSSPGRTVAAERMLTHIWGRTTERERRTLKQLVYRLRNKLEAVQPPALALETTPNAGYRLVVE